MILYIVSDDYSITDKELKSIKNMRARTKNGEKYYPATKLTRGRWKLRIGNIELVFKEEQLEFKI